MKYSGCIECFQCRNNHVDKCSLNDDLSIPLEELKTADCAIISSPIFYADISSQLKGFIDRTWAYFGKTGMSIVNPKMDRSLVFIVTYGLNDNHVYDDVFERYRKYFSMFGFTKQYFIKGYGAQYFDMKLKNQDQVNSEIDFVVDKLGR
jgi:multimeric flavodoxin WrbA